MIAEILFLGACTLILYAYIGYPALITIMSLFSGSRVITKGIEPFVSLLISAYNEEKDIGRKLDNSLSLDYPKDKFEIIVASDGSSDATDKIVKSYENNDKGVKVVLHRVEGRLGKTAAQNSAITICRGEIIIFSDAASLYDLGAIGALVRNFADSTIGAVSGMCKYVNKTGTSVGFATILFWKLESFIKNNQTKIRTATGCSGCIYAARKNLYTALPPSIISDLVEPLTIVKKGYRIAFEPLALAFEETTEKPKDEFKMRVRVIVRGMNGLLFMRSLLNPLKYPFVSFQLLSHKVLRWFVPVFCIVAFFSSLYLSLDSRQYQILFIAQCLFYLLALCGLLLEKKGIRMKLFYLPMYFAVVNTASLISLFKVLKGENIVVWQTQR